CQLTFQPRRTRTVILATTAAVLSVQTVFLNVFLLGAICAASIAVLAVRKAWRGVALIFGIGLTAALSMLPYLPMIREANKSLGVRAIANSVGYITRFFVWTLTTDNLIAGGMCLVLLAGGSALIVVPTLRRRLADPVERTGEHFLF